MSVIKANTGDSLNDYFTDLANFENMKHHMLNQPDFNIFIRWFDKLRILEPRATWLYLKANKNCLTEEQTSWVETIYSDLFPKGFNENSG